MTIAEHPIAQRALRADARRNHERVLTAARQAFAEHGVDASVDEIARRAGVGTATLYRRFPCKRDLIAAIFESSFAALDPAVTAALAHQDAHRGLVMLLQAVLDLQAHDQGFMEMARGLGPEAVPDSVRDGFFAPFAQLLKRAQASGQIRKDVGPEDLPMIMRMVGASSADGPSPARVARRRLALVLDALSPAAASSLPSA